MSTLDELPVSPAKELTRPHNLFWDTLFYDVSNLSKEEHDKLSRAPDKEGSVIVVSPSASPRGVRHYLDAKEMLAKESQTIAAVAVPGVGCSVVGSASLARTVADTLNADVVAIVSGYGALDVLQEAVGGWFFYGYTDKFKHYTEAATEALAKILEERPPNLKLLLGHSKGSTVIDFVLERYVALNAKSELYDNLIVITAGSVISLPKQFKKSHQVIGGFDWFGGLNSVPGLLTSQVDGIKPTVVPYAWHHLNRNYWFSLDLGTELKKVMAMA